jgi:hypothetical protein
VEAEEDTDDSDSLYKPSQSSSDGASGAIAHPRTQKLRSEAGKRPHSVTPGEAEVIRELMKSKAKLAQSEEAGMMMVDAGPRENQQDSQDVREAWPAIWDSLKDIWPSTAQTGFPLETSSTEAWARVAVTEPLNLLRMLQNFQYPEELLTKLSETVLESWTAGWRRECILFGVANYRNRTKDITTRNWLDDWKKRIAKPPPHALLPMIDSREDWAKLRSRGYGEDEVLKFCDIGNKGRLANHMLCALVFEKEIRVLTDKEDENDNGGRTRLVRHLHARQAVPGYKQAFETTPHKVDWHALTRFLSKTLEPGFQERGDECVM